MQLSYHSYYDDEKGSYDGAVPSIVYPSDAEPSAAEEEKTSADDIKSDVSE